VSFLAGVVVIVGRLSFGRSLLIPSANLTAPPSCWGSSPFRVHRKAVLGSHPIISSSLPSSDESDDIGRARHWRVIVVFGNGNVDVDEVGCSIISDQSCWAVGDGTSKFLNIIYNQKKMNNLKYCVVP
jgi:hypothetical protein